MLGEMKCGDDEIDEFDPNEWNNDAAETVDEQVALEDGERAHRFVSDAAQRQRNQRDDDKRVENHGAQDRARRAVQMHDVERGDRGECRHQHGRDNGEIFGDIIGDAKGG